MSTAAVSVSRNPWLAFAGGCLAALAAVLLIGEAYVRLAPPRDIRRAALRACAQGNAGPGPRYLTPVSSTSNTRVAFAGITGGMPSRP